MSGGATGGRSVLTASLSRALLPSTQGAREAGPAAEAPNTTQPKRCFDRLHPLAKCQAESLGQLSSSAPNDRLRLIEPTYRLCTGERHSGRLTHPPQVSCTFKSAPAEMNTSVES